MNKGKRILRSIKLLAIAGVIGVSGAYAQQINVTGASASPGSVQPGEGVTVTVELTNSDGNAANVFPAGASVDATMTLTNKVTGTSFDLSGTATATAAIEAEGGAGTVVFSDSVPTQTTDSGNYSYSITISNASSGAVGVASAASSEPALTVTGNPDFRITSLTYPAGISYEGADTIPMSLTYTNLTSSSGFNNVPYVPGSIHSSTFRIEVILSSNPTFGDADDFLLTAHTVGARVNADGVDRTINWTQLLPGNFSGSYYVLAKIDTQEQVTETVEDDLTQNGNNIWYDVNASRIALDPSNFPTIYWGSKNGDKWSDQPVNNEDGRYTVYASDSTNLVTGDTNGVRDVFVFDQQTTTTRRLSVSQQGVESNGTSQSPFISSDSTMVAFSSDATNLILGDTNGFSDIYLVATFTGAISRVNLHDDGTQADGSSFRPALSETGRYVVFESTATNLITAGTTFGITHIYRRDTQTNTTELISVDSGGVQSNGNSTQARVSADGRYVVFASDGTNLVAGDTNASRDIFLRDTQAGTTVRVSVATGGTEGNGASRSPSISADGAYVAFHSLASNLIAGDTNGVADVFVHEVATSATSRVSISTAGAEATDPSGGGFQLGSVNPSISSTGRFVTYASMANNLTDGDSLGQYQATDANGAIDVFVRDRDVTDTGTFDTPGNVATYMVSRNRFGSQTVTLLGTPSTAASDIFPSISADGRWVAFPSDAENTAGLVHGDTNRTSPDLNTFRDVFIYDRRINALPNPSNDPTVSITAPVDGSSISIGSTVSVVGSATAPAGTVASVQFYVNGISLSTITNAPYTVDWSPTVAGSYTLSALVVDSFGNQGVSSNVTVTVTTVSPNSPTVSLTSPANGATVTVNTATTLQATASDTDGTIASVQFFANGQSLGSDDTFPYTLEWTPTALGSVSLTAEATDSGGNSATSTAAVVTVSSTTVGGPTVSVTSPAGGSTLPVNSAMTVTATASDADGSIASVEFFANGVSIGSDAVFPYSVSWTPVSEGAVSLTAQAVDNDGKTGDSAAVAITISGGGAPTVSISSPAGGDTVAVNSTVFIAGTAADADGTIVSVEFFVNGVALVSDSTFPYTASWTPTVTGAVTLTAQATDNNGNVTTSAGVAVTVSAVSAGAPTVSVSSPASGSSVLVNQSVAVEASASDADGTIALVNFYVNEVFIGSDTNFPYATTWTPVALGNYAVIARATDDEGNVTTSTTNTVSVIAGGLPTVIISAPAVASSFDIGSSVTVTAVPTATAPATITSVQFLANGEEIGLSTSAPYSISWKPLQSGAYTLTAVATDSLATTATSSSVPVTFNTTSTVAVDSPSDGTSVLINTETTIEASASDTAGTIARVDIFANGVLLGTDATFPYAVAWTPVALGDYAIVAVATDDEGNITSSTANIVTVSAGGVPSVSVSAPANGSSFDIGSTVTITGVPVAVAPRTVASVAFLVDGVQVGSAVTAAPYTVDWKPVQAGTYTVTAVVTDSLATTATSSSVSVTFDSTSTVAVTSPANGSSVPVNVATTIQATASDSAGTITAVEFFANGVSLGSDDAFPYTVAWNPTALGSYAIVARAQDDEGNLTNSATNTVTVSSGNPPTATITLPTAGALLPVNTPATIAVTANDVDGTIASVEFFANGLSLGTDTVFPFNFSWTSNVTGSVSLTAVATDNTGNVATSSAVVVTVGGGSTPSASLTSPAAGSSFVVGNPITVSASALAVAPATVDSVRFLANGKTIGVDAASPYTVSWTPSSPGSYTLVAEVTDTIGNIGSSAGRTITITDNSPPSVSLTNPAGSQTIQLGASLLLSANASDADGQVTSVQFLTNGILVGTDTTLPYSFSWQPNSAGTYSVIAVATDNVGNVTSSAARTVTVQSAAAPSVVMDKPINGQNFVVGSPVQVSALATAAAGSITQVEFLVNGASLVGPSNPDLVVPFGTTWTPTAAGSYTFAAVATDSAGQTTISAAVTVTVSANQAPSATLVSPVSGTGLSVGTPISLIASASDTDGTIASVSFLANGLFIGTSTAPPYAFSWTPGAAGGYSLVARAVDNSGNVTESTAVSVNVAANNAPTISISAPRQGSSVVLGSSTTLRALAGDSGGNVTDVSFYGNGVLLGSDATVPFELDWTPKADGIYRLVATATDNGGDLSSSTEIIIAVIDPAQSEISTVYTGSYVAGAESGKFTIVRQGAISSTFVATSDDATPKTYFYDDISVDVSGNFSLVRDGVTKIAGQFGEAGLSGKFDNDRALMIGVIALPVSSYNGPVGVINGSFGSQTDSEFVAMVAPDGRLTLYARSGGQTDVGVGSFDSTGTFSVTTSAGGQMSGRLDPVTGFLSGTSSGGAISGNLLGAVSSSTPASDGFLRNLSTRGFVGSGSDILVAGFVVNGVAPKQVLVRAIGPTLADFGVPGAVSDPLLKLYRGSTVIGSNDDWGTNPAVPAASAIVGAFALPAGSTDSALVTTLMPGPYTAQVSGVSGATGVGLVEIYDVDTQTAFSAEKMLNVSTRGKVGPEELIAGVIINGVTPKRVMIRAIGPTLAQFGVSGALADPVLRLVNQENGAVVRENNDWQTGNDALAVAKAASQVGAFAIGENSKDAVLLITLPPGRYTALVSSGSGVPGVALVEVYEIP